MSDGSGGMAPVPLTAPVVRAVRMFVAPVDRSSGQAVVFDPAAQGRFEVGAPPRGWIDMGAVQNLKRTAETSFAEVWSGSPALLKTRARAKVEAAVSCTFAKWSKLAMALSSGSQQMNLLQTAASAVADDSGGAAAGAAVVLAGSTATVLQIPVGSAVAIGDAVVVDEDYQGTTGFVGSGIAGGYVRSAGAIGNDVDYVRRVSFNVGRVVYVTAGIAGAMAVTLASPLLAGVPTATMKLNVLAGFVDRLGGSFVSEWSALFVMDGVQGDRVLLHYPRLQIAPGMAEVTDELAAGLERWRLQAQFHALPVTDTNDGEAVLCLRSYLPAAGRML